MAPQSGTSKKQNKAAKNAKMTAARQRVAEQRERERKSAKRRSILIGTAAAVVAAGVIAGLAAVVMTSDDGKSGNNLSGNITADVSAAPNITSPIEGVATYTASQGHEPNKNITYKQTPPVGGQHDPVWQNCGIYSQPIQDRNGVHSMEHGAIWITYNPSLPADQVAKLQTKARTDFMLLSPHDGMSSPITVSSWGFQLKVDNPDDPRIDAFIKQYRVNKQTTPEYGAACTGGIGKPE